VAAPSAIPSLNDARPPPHHEAGCRPTRGLWRGPNRTAFKPPRAREAASGARQRERVAAVDDALAAERPAVEGAAPARLLAPDDGVAGQRRPCHSMRGSAAREAAPAVPGARSAATAAAISGHADSASVPAQSDVPKGIASQRAQAHHVDPDRPPVVVANVVRVKLGRLAGQDEGETGSRKELERERLSEGSS